MSRTLTGSTLISKQLKQFGALVLVLLLGCLLTGCGRTGSLYLPAKANTHHQPTD